MERNQQGVGVDNNEKLDPALVYIIVKIDAC